MSSSTAEHAGEAQQPSYHTYEEQREAARHDRSTRIATSSHSARRLFWTLSGPLTTSISIMEKPNNPDSLEPYFNQSTNTFHTVSAAPLTEPKVSSITVNVYELERWEEDWMDWHRNHSEPYGGEENHESVVWGELEDYNEDSDEEAEEGVGGKLVRLLWCCEEKRPRKKNVNITVKPAAGGDGFVTVHDYLSAVHPWLMSLRGDIMGAMTMWDDETVFEMNGDGEIMPTMPSSASDVMVDHLSPARLKMRSREMWIKKERDSPKLEFSSYSISAR